MDVGPGMEEGERVLVVEDDQAARVGLEQLIGMWGYTVASASDGDEALTQLDDVDVVVLDMVMPGQDGIATLQEIKQRKPLVEVILLTGHGTLESAVKALELGAFYYLMKPAEMRELLENVAGAFKRKAEHEGRIRQAAIKRILML